MRSDVTAPYYGRSYCPTDVQHAKRKLFAFRARISRLYRSEIENSNLNHEKGAAKLLIWKLLI